LTSRGGHQGKLEEKLKESFLASPQSRLLQPPVAIPPASQPSREDKLKEKTQEDVLTMAGTGMKDFAAR
jgi:hypothetical protein